MRFCLGKICLFAALALAASFRSYAKETPTSREETIPTEEVEQQNVLTNAIEVRHLKPEQADRPYHVELEGVVTMSNSRSLVLQDASGGVYIHFRTPPGQPQPHPGEIWRINGITGAGDFSPVIYATDARFVRHGTLPEPIIPTWDQLLGGSLDAEQIEIRGVVIEASKSRVKLLTQGGATTILSDSFYPLPFEAMTDEEVTSLIGCLVRFRGVYASSWDISIGRVHPTEFHLGNAVMTLEKPALENPFAATAAHAKDLLGFASHLNALEPVKVTGLVLYTKPPLFFLTDAEQGFRAICRKNCDVVPGDQVEVVGYSQPGGPSPILQEAAIRKIGRTKMPAPIALHADEILDSRFDSTRVRLEATVLSDSVRQNERILECNSGNHHFFAYVPSISDSLVPLEKNSIIRLTGTYLSNASNKISTSSNLFELRLQNKNDIEVLQRGPWWTFQHTVILITILCGALLLAVAWVASLHRTVARRSKELAREIEERESLERHRILEQERSRVAQDLHDELGSGLTEAGFLTALMKNPEISIKDKDGYLDQLRQVCHSLVSGLDEIVWAVNPRYDSAEDLADYFSLFAPRFLNLAGIRCRLQIDDQIPKIPLSPHQRHAIFLATKEALTNVVRHSNANEVILAISVKSTELLIRITDDGSGFTPVDEQGNRNGLRGMKDRLEQIGGNFSIESTPGIGSTVHFIIPLKGIE
ncbi:ATP-binding protein [Luteolibacter pohnpeiensis]|uniref:histidine kinase n=1 Tax=Luteolibacter pohnpeiensis TaxID=454153 RepID=A0A934VV52_9BACT|nr:ATP-binding protein [Luteolibacter pohnpeiensis]MBK1881825.1 ATP-binding protein [Luteolibacter pohnpeiensis]